MEMQMDKKTELKEVLRQYKDVFAWSFEDMKGLDPAFYQHQVYSSRADHFTHLQLCLEKCRLYRLSLNPTKCVLG